MGIQSKSPPFSLFKRGTNKTVRYDILHTLRLWAPYISPRYVLVFLNAFNPHHIFLNLSFTNRVLECYKYSGDEYKFERVLYKMTKTKKITNIKQERVTE